MLVANARNIYIYCFVGLPLYVDGAASKVSLLYLYSLSEGSSDDQKVLVNMEPDSLNLELSTQ